MSKYSVGDFVIVVKPENPKPGWGEDMDNFIGNVCKIVDILPDVYAIEIVDDRNHLGKYHFYDEEIVPYVDDIPDDIDLNIEDLLY